MLALVGGEDTLLQAPLFAEWMVYANVVHCPPMVVCNEEYRFVIAEQLRLMGKGVIVLEPFGRNTAPALTLAALAAVRDGADPILLVMPADHVITDTRASRQRWGRGRYWPMPAPS